MRFIQNAVGRQRFQLIKNVTVVWAYEIYPTIKALCSLTQLEVLATVFPSEPRIDCPWNYFGGFELLSNLRRVQDLKMAGKDLVWMGNGPEGSLDDADDSSSDEEGGGESKNGKWQYVDINHDRAIGLWLRNFITPSNLAATQRTWLEDLASIRSTSARYRTSPTHIFL